MGVEGLAARAWAVAGEVRDPEMPMLTLADLGVLRGVQVEGDVVITSITPTYSGCPAMATMRDDLIDRLTHAGFARVEVRVVLDPAWSSDWISDRGRAALSEAGLSPPALSRSRRAGRDGAGPRGGGPVARGGGPAARGGDAGVWGGGPGTWGGGPVALSLGPIRRALRCPRCGSAHTQLLSEFGATACKALYRCTECLEPFEHVKEI
ncbi:1,2-phenylacetyl-CoA epoxidase subunit PaaD [Cryptosporangium phraense]|uniref:Phenylacetate-CoA oxygenase subunit PaaJ n=1 Tax=Cryptosporangium phraense TaxID=2593070 RepID=A0A545ANQ3_9ACTN|nr:1,2-phenylacetyl-CoA epoxidase subunit PaaD [Cryptosporangium phraense]TQS42916.1 phenylacetate-CoA oxygenase subunit PaaJ [Cryptosporangium phraense]